MKALISPQEVIYGLSGETIGYRVADVVKDSFEVADPMYWVDAPNEGVSMMAYLNGMFVPLPEAPAGSPSVSRFQARAALYQAGMLQVVDALMTDPTTDPIAKLAWTDAQEFKRNSPTVAVMAPALGLTDSQLDDIFRFAKTIDA